MGVGVGIGETNGAAKDVSIVGDIVFVAVGAGGVDMFDVTNIEDPVFLTNYNTSGYASRVSANDSLVAVSDWDDIEIIRWDNSPRLELAGIKKTGGRVMAAAMDDPLVYSAEWGRLMVYEYGPVAGPDLDLSHHEFD